MSKVTQRILGEAESSLPRFKSQPHSLMTGKHENYALYDELLAPLIAAYELRSFYTQPQALVDLVNRASAGHIYAYEIDEDFVYFLTVPLTEWKAKVIEFKRRLAGRDATG